MPFSQHTCNQLSQDVQNRSSSATSYPGYHCSTFVPPQEKKPKKPAAGVTTVNHLHTCVGVVHFKMSYSCSGLILMRRWIWVHVHQHHQNKPRHQQHQQGGAEPPMDHNLQESPHWLNGISDVTTESYSFKICQQVVVLPGVSSVRDGSEPNRVMLFSSLTLTWSNVKTWSGVQDPNPNLFMFMFYTSLFVFE